MIIRKQFKFEAAHIVRGCTSQRCRENIHGHSYIVEVFVEGKHLDQGAMILDFCLFDQVKDFVDSFDHSYCLWDKDDQDFKEMIYQWNTRVVEMPISPSAEGYALLLLTGITDLFNRIERKNGEGDFSVSSVRVHETATGYAEAFSDDLEWSKISLSDLHFTDAVQADWKSFQGFKTC